ncbi:hypothetical protein DFH09DRAFT_1324579 [Mycena vulgaris]|nr:hypothetical protein DFH09DRAFT_1324579 [Mycena vulgaris]
MSVSARLVEVHKRLEDIDDEIGGTLAHLQRLKARRMDILVDLNAVTSPILSLPPELICEIFLHCLPPQRTLPSPKDAPLLLAQVCRQWRGIALSLPVLWTSICVAVVLSADPRDELLSAVLDLWLERAGNCTLSVSMILDSANLPLPEMLFRGPRSAVFRKIRHASHRWRELEIVRRLEDFPVFLHRDTPWNLPELVKLTLLLSNGGRHPTAFPPNTLSNLMDAPALREVHLMGFTPTNLLLPWSQLTTVHAENLLPIECLQTLAQTSNLVDGTFSLWPTRFFHLPNHAPIARLSRLKSLTITGELCTEILDHFECPALERFTLSFGPNNDFTPLTAFISRYPSITNVSLDARTAVRAGEFIGVLEAMTSVETLSFGLHVGLMNGMLPDLLRINPAFLPSLRHLVIRERIDRYNEPRLVDEVVVDMLRARWAAGLKSFCLVTTHVFPVIHPGFTALAQEGMGIELRSHGSGPFLVIYFNSALQAK